MPIPPHVADFFTQQTRTRGERYQREGFPAAKAEFLVKGNWKKGNVHGL